MQHDAAMMLLSGGAKARVSPSGGDPPAIGASAACKHRRHGINEAAVSRPDVLRTADEQLFDKRFKSRRQFIQAAI